MTQKIVESLQTKIASMTDESVKAKKDAEKRVHEMEERLFKAESELTRTLVENEKMSDLVKSKAKDIAALKSES